MISVAGNKRHQNEHTLDMKYAALMELEQGVPNKMSLKMFIVPKNKLSTWRQNRDKIATAFKGSGGTKRQRIKVN